MPDTTVKCFRNTDGGAPSLNNATGCLIDLLDACLVDGYGSKTLSSLVVASGVATATVSTGHEFVNFGDTGVGPVVLIAGSAVTELNGEKRINVTSATTFTFDATGVADGTAGGTITAKMAPAGWEKVYSGTNKAVYRPTDITSNRMYLRVDDTGTINARVRGYESMSDVDTGTNPFPTDAQLSGGFYFLKSNGSTARDWVLVANPKGFHAMVDYSGNDYWYGGFSFCDLLDAKAGDAYATRILGNGTALANYLGSGGNYSYLPRTMEGITGSLEAWNGRALSGGNQIFVSGEPYPAANEGKIRFIPIELRDGTSSTTSPYRGMIPGIIGAGVAAATGIIYLTADIGTDRERIVMLKKLGGTSGIGAAFEVTGPWQ